MFTSHGWWCVKVHGNCWWPKFQKNAWSGPWKEETWLSFVLITNMMPPCVLGEPPTQNEMNTKPTYCAFELNLGELVYFSTSQWCSSSAHCLCHYGNWSPRIKKVKWFTFLLCTFTGVVFWVSCTNILYNSIFFYV